MKLKYAQNNLKFYIWLPHIVTIFHVQKWFEDEPHLNDRKVLRLVITIGVELSYIVLQVKESSFVPSSYHKCPTSSHLGHEKQRVAYVYNGMYVYAQNEFCFDCSLIC